MNDPMEKFEDFFNAALAPGILDHKTKQLVALGAALAAGCDSWTDSGLAGARAAQASEQEIEEVAAIAMAVTAQAIRKQFRKNNPATRSDSDQQTIITPALSLQPGRS